MKFVFHRSATCRRAATGTVLALAAATLSLGVAGQASAANTIELEGTVTGVGGVPLANALVGAFDATTGGNLENAYTDANGHYQFDDDYVVGQIKLQFEADNPTLTLSSPIPYDSRWSGGSRYKSGASVTTTSVDPATAPVVNANLPLLASVSGNVLVGDGHVATYYWETWAQNSDEGGAVRDETTDDATGNYRMIVSPDGPVRVGAWAVDSPVGAGDYTYYLNSYWQNSDTLAGATPINVSPGASVGGINFRLTNSLTARQAPSILGYPTVGRPLTAAPGTWSRNAGTEFSYTWMRNGVVVGSGASYVPTVADYHQRLVLVVTALNGQNAGRAASVPSDIVRYAASVRSNARALSGRRVAVHVKMVSAKQSPVRGKMVVLRNGHIIRTGLKLVHGKVAFVLKHQPKGRQTYTVRYQGNRKLAKVQKSFTVRVHK